jgi:hypothetical protein
MSDGKPEDTPPANESGALVGEPDQSNVRVADNPPGMRRVLAESGPRKDSTSPSQADEKRHVCDAVMGVSIDLGLCVCTSRKQSQGRRAHCASVATRLLRLCAGNLIFYFLLFPLPNQDAGLA